MSVRRLLLSVLAVAAFASADSCDSDASIQSDDDVSQYSSCSTIKGDVTVGTSVTSLEMDSVEQITGSLKINGAAGLTSISMPKLQSIEGDFTLTGLTVLSTLSCPQLKSVGNLDFTTLPALQSLQFTSEITMASSVTISDTLLGALTGINVQTVKTFDINNNKYLKSVDVQLANVSDSITIASNSKDLNASFPNLIWANNVTVRDAGGVMFPSLASLNNSISFVNNTFEEASFPNLTTVGQSFAFVSCTKLTNVSAPELTKVGGTFQFANNTKFTNLTDFGKLASVGGSIDLSGVFEDVELPSLDDVRGGTNVQSTETLDGCDSLKKLHDSGDIKGDFTCEGKLSTANSKDGGASTSGGSGSSNSSSSSKKSGSERSSGASLSVAALLSVGAIVMAL